MSWCSARSPVSECYVFLVLVPIMWGSGISLKAWLGKLIGVWKNYNSPPLAGDNCAQFALPKTSSPNVGLEPTTLRLRVSCSTDWASRACLMAYIGQVSWLYWLVAQFNSNMIEDYVTVDALNPVWQDTVPANQICAPYFCCPRPLITEPRFQCPYSQPLSLSC